jgi:outer membrane translocation and assembly module TamA
LYNLEYRTRPWLLQSVQVGLVAFYDAGSVYERLSKIKLHHALGAGLRVLLPQFNPYAFRLDVGFPLEQKSYAVLLSYGGDQVIPLTPEDDAYGAAGRQHSLAP